MKDTRFYLEFGKSRAYIWTSRADHKHPEDEMRRVFHTYTHVSTHSFRRVRMLSEQDGMRSKVIGINNREITIAVIRD